MKPIVLNKRAFDDLCAEEARMIADMLEGWLREDGLSLRDYPAAALRAKTIEIMGGDPLTAQLWGDGGDYAIPFDRIWQMRQHQEAVQP